MRCCTADENRERFPIPVWIWREAAAATPNQECFVRDSVTDAGVEAADTTGMITSPTYFLTTYFPPMFRDIWQSETTRWWNFLEKYSVCISFDTPWNRSIFDKSTIIIFICHLNLLYVFSSFPADLKYDEIAPISVQVNKSSSHIPSLSIKWKSDVLSLDWHTIHTRCAEFI